MDKFAGFVIQFFTRHGETIQITRIIKALEAELAKRAEYALRYGGR